MFNRDIINKLNNWKENYRNKVFIVQGARQVGKTFFINEYCKMNFSSYYYLNLEEDYFSYDLLSKVKGKNDFYDKLILIFPEITSSSETVLFIDEVQRIPFLITLSKFLCIDGKFRYIYAGSLLGLILSEVSSWPVGYCEIHTMYPMSFIEFLKAKGTEIDLIEKASKYIKEYKELPEDIFYILMDSFKDYLLVGGMPEVVSEYIMSGSMDKIFEIQSQILTSYKKDFTKYESINKRLSIISLYDKICANLQKEYNEYDIDTNENNNNFSEIENSIDWIVKSNCGLKVTLSGKLVGGIKQNERKYFKLYLSDVGLLNASYGDYFRDLLNNHFDETDKGFIYENFACQELVSLNFKLYYYHFKKHGEVDFVIESRNFGRIVPIEVKSGKDYSIHKALDNVLDDYPNLSNGIVYCNSNVKVIDKIVYLPIFAVGFLEEEK